MRIRFSLTERALTMRLPPLPADQWDEAVERALAPMLPADGPRDANNALATFAHHPALAKAFLRFNVHLLYSSTLPPRIPATVSMSGPSTWHWPKTRGSATTR